DLFAYKDTFYNPSNVVISVAGNVDTEFITKVEDYFNQFENESKQNKIEKPIFIAEDLRRSKDTEQANVCFGFDGLLIYDVRYSRFAVLNNVLDLRIINWII